MLHSNGLGMEIGETRKDYELPRISVNISDDLAQCLDEQSAAQKRSVSSEASLILETSPQFLGWKAMKKHMPKEKAQ